MDEQFSEYFNYVERHALLRSKPSRIKVRLYMNYLFQDVLFDGKSMLDIGGGRGAYSLYGACMGAKLVICLEPELEGSTSGVSSKLAQLGDSLPPNSIIITKETLQEFNPAGQTFDIILLNNSINHLDEKACINLQSSGAARKKYESIFHKLSELAAPGAKLIIADCSRDNFFNSIGLRNPFAPEIEWFKHQSPKHWSKMLHEFGFVNPQIRWLYFSPFRILSRLPFYNLFASCAAYFMASQFCLVMDKRAISKIAV